MIKRVRVLTLNLFKWYHRESNQGHTDFQSVALPTELWYQFGLQIYCLFLFYARDGFHFIIRCNQLV
jgi:hypothetical protein